MNSLDETKVEATSSLSQEDAQLEPESQGEELELDLENLIQESEEFVKNHFKNHDPSHDFNHVHRVRLLALGLTNCPSLGREVDNLVVELAALFHDLCDKKYLPEGNTGPIKASSVLSPLLSHFKLYLTPSQISTIHRIVDNVSWSKDEARRKERSVPDYQPSTLDQEQIEWENSCLEFQIVSDADRLDAIGSIGILRCAAFSAIKDRPLFIPPNNPENDSIPPAEQAQGYNGSCIAHFHEKLLKIKGDRLRTQSARDEADRRQRMMQSFLTELDLEWLVASQGAQLSMF